MAKEYYCSVCGMSADADDDFCMACGGEIINSVEV